MQRRGAAKTIVLIALVAVAGVAFWLSTYTLKETEQAVITQFGDPVGEPVTGAGLHFKVPLIRKVHRFEKRVQTWDGEATDMVTAEQRNISIDTTARWRITNPLTFYQRLGDEASAQTRLDDILDSTVQETVASTELAEIVRSKDWEVAEEDLEMVVQPEGEGKQLQRDVRTGRVELVRQVKQQAAAQIADYGIELLDVRIKRINYVESVQQRVFERMISERQRMATKFREEGKEEAQRIQADADRQVAEIESEARREAEVVRGEADAEATRIYNQAYAEDPEFYAFSRTLESYRSALGQDSVLMLSTDSAYFRYLRRLRPEGTPPPPDHPEPATASPQAER